MSQDCAPKPADILRCVCGAKREFEFQVIAWYCLFETVYLSRLLSICITPSLLSLCFQVMPQLLYYLKLDTISDHSVDWGTLLVYSCAASCSHGGLETEVVWKQDFSSNTS